MTENLLRFNKNQHFLIWDCESENLALFNCPDSKNRAWEVGYILSRGKEVLKEGELHPWWPDLNVGKEAAIITRFNHYEYRQKATDARKCYEQFAEMLYDPSTIIVGQNVLNFDGFLVQNWRQELGLKPDWSFIERTIDTRALAFAIQKGIKSVDRDDLFCWQMKFMNTREKGIKTSLEYLMKSNGLFYDRTKHHLAIEDARMTRDIFMKQIWEVEI